MDNKYLLDLCEAAKSGKVILHVEGASKASSQLFKGSGAVGTFDADELKKSVALREEIFGDLIQTGQTAVVTDI